MLLLGKYLTKKAVIARHDQAICMFDWIAGSSPSMTIFVVYLLFALTACGFTPLYSDHSDGEAIPFQNVKIARISEREGQILRNNLMDRFYLNGAPTYPDYTIIIQPLAESNERLDITEDADTTRERLRLSTTMMLRDERTGQIVFEQPLTGFVSYNVLESEFATRLARADAREDIIRELAGKVQRHFALYFHGLDG